LTPLMRRMVTNERQRQYARRTRHSGATVQTFEQERPHNSVHHEQCAERETSLPNSLGSPNFSQHVKSALPSPHQRSTFTENCIECVVLVHNAVAFRCIISECGISYAGLRDQIQDHVSHYEHNNVSNVKTTLSLTYASTDGCGTEHAVLKAQKVAKAVEVHAMANHAEGLSIEVHGPDGLRKVSEEEGWRKVKSAIENAVWTLGFIKVVVKVGSSDNAYV